jgi:NADH-quinone oxidoreductase subunit M
MKDLLLITLFLPLAGALLLPRRREPARLFALTVTLIALGLTIAIVSLFPSHPSGAESFGATNACWFGGAGSSIDIRFSIALDGLSLWLFALTSLLSVVAMLVGWEAIEEQASLYYRLLLVLETGLLGVFVARDIILFYVFFEATLIPLFFLIGIWGSEQRRLAAMKFFLFTLAGSVLTFLGLLAIVLWDCYHPVGTAVPGRMTFFIPNLTNNLRLQPMDPTVQVAIFLALFAGFAVKTPLFPLHTWLPLAHVEAPAAGSVLLAGVLLKVGVYGFARFCLPMLPYAAATLMPWLLWLSVAGIVYGAFVALAQTDIKRLIAYSSVSHLGFCTLGLFALTSSSIEGGALQMINHGLATGGLFAMVGMLYERFHTRRIGDIGGLARRMPKMAALTFVLVLSSIGLPGLGGFVGEFLVLLGTFQRAWVVSHPLHWMQYRFVSAISISSIVLGAWYMLWMYQRVFFGPERIPTLSSLAQGAGKNEGMKKSPFTIEDGKGEGGQSSDLSADARLRDLSLREFLILAPLAAMLLWIGLQPRFFLDRMNPALDILLAPAMNAAKESEEPESAKTEQGEESRNDVGEARRLQGGFVPVSQSLLSATHPLFLIFHPYSNS